MGFPLARRLRKPRCFKAASVALLGRAMLEENNVFEKAATT
jgi:hypothetical protein